ncbi:unnamed protein product [Penicillium salamii]|nr:unnamed protein product [Penicillium salamii]CAG8087656.1 unnamed protein product [Penicillium salamii]
MAYTSFLVPSLKTSQHNLGGVYTNNRYGHSIASFAARKSILPGNVSELSRPLLRSINYLSKILCSKRRTALLIFMPLYIGAAHCHCETSLLGVLLPDRRYGHGGTTTRAPSRLAPRPHRLHTTNGGVYEALAAPFARFYPITTVHFPVTGASSRTSGSQELPGAPSAPSSKRQPESVTNWMQHHVNMG